MIVSVDVYSKDIDASLAAFKKALDTGAKDICLTSNHDWDTKEFMYLNLRFEAEHNNEALASLDDGPFQKDSEF